MLKGLLQEQTEEERNENCFKDESCSLLRLSVRAMCGGVSLALFCCSSYIFLKSFLSDGLLRTAYPFEREALEGPTAA